MTNISRALCAALRRRLSDHFPDAFEGKSTKLRDTLVNLVLDKPDEWQTQVALPFVKIEGTVRTQPHTHTHKCPPLRHCAIAPLRHCAIAPECCCRWRSQTVEWDEMHFDVRLLQRVPVSCRRYSNAAASVVRRTRS